MNRLNCSGTSVIAVRSSHSVLSSIASWMRPLLTTTLPAVWYRRFSLPSPRNNSMAKTGRIRANPVHVVNTEITKLVSTIRGTTPPLGEGIQHLQGSDLTDAVVIHRMVGKFFEPVAGLEKEQHRNAVQSMVSHDERGFTFTPQTLAELPRKHLYGARNTLSDWFRGLRPSYRFRPPSGESALSNQGLTDVYYKLSDTSHWEVSAGALPYATAICYNNLWLKRLVRSKFRSEEPTGCPWKTQVRRWYLQAREQSRVSVGYYVFGKMFASLCTLNEVSRVTSIFKDARGRRVITMVPFWNMVCQLSYMGDIRDMASLRLGYHLDTRADLHKTLIRHRSSATIDLRNASNSVWQDVVDFLFPPQMLRVLNDLVDKHYEYDLEDEQGTRYGYFNMFAPMGCGLTFDVMTFMLLAVGRQFDPSTSVFGDDIIVKGKWAATMIACIEAMGLEVNTSKSFITGNFSESCGGFYNHSTEQDITCFDLKWADNRQSAFANANKLYAIICAGQVSASLKNRLTETHQRILDQLAHYAVAKPHVTTGIPSGYVWSSATFERKKTEVVRLIEKQWQRRVDAVPISVRKRETEAPCEGIPAYAAWFLRNGSYEPNTAKDVNQVTMCDAESQSPLNEVLLVSIL
nr:MAG: RNA-dependent RNA polymerase [Riboviria sp.]